MSTSVNKPDPRRHDGEIEFFSFLDSLRQRFDPPPGSGSEEDGLLDWFALEDDEFIDSVAATGARAAPLEEPTVAAELPIQLAAPLRSWRRTWGELALAFGILVAFELAFGRGIGSYGLEPHPYWLAILPIAAARGLVAGLTAACIGAVLFVFGTVQAHAVQNWTDLFEYRHGMTPLGFFLAAFLVGQIRDTLAVRYGELWRHAIHLASDRARAAARVQRLAQTNRDLEVRLLDHSAQFGHLLDAAKRLQSATRKDLLEVTLDMIVEHCGGQRCSAIDVRGGDLRVVAIRGWSLDDVAQVADVATRSASIRRAVAAGERYNAFAVPDAAVDDGPLLIAPVCGEDGTVEALLCLDSLHPERFSQSTASVFFGIGEWAQIGMQRLAAGRDPGDLTPDGHALLRSYAWVGSAGDLPARLRVEDGRVAATGVTTCLIAIHALVDAEREPNQDKLDQLLESTVLNGLMRGSDSLHRLPDPGSWVVVLPATSKAAARVVQQRLEALLGVLQFGQLRGFRTEVVAPEPWRGTLVGLIPALSAWVRDPRHGALPRARSAAAPIPYAILDAIEFARRVQVESHLARRYDTELYVVELDFESVPVDSPEAVVPLLTTFAERFLPQIATVHLIEGNRFALVLPRTRCSSAFRAGHELSRSIATRLGLPTNQGVRFGVFALSGLHGDADTLLFDLFRIKGRRVQEDSIEAQVMAQSAGEASP